MPPKFKFTREEILSAALSLTRESGIAAVTSRGLAARLGSSAKPIFGLFQNMEEVQQEIIKAAKKLYRSYIESEIESGKYPPYKASGMAYIRFAKEEKELFRLLFMCERSQEKITQNADEIAPLIDIIRKNTGLDAKTASLFHLEIWMLTHGVAATIATSYAEWDDELISRILTDGYEGIKYRFCGKE